MDARLSPTDIHSSPLAQLFPFRKFLGMATMEEYRVDGRIQWQIRFSRNIAMCSTVEHTGIPLTRGWPCSWPLCFIVAVLQTATRARYGTVKPEQAVFSTSSILRRLKLAKDQVYKSWVIVSRPGDRLACCLQVDSYMGMFLVTTSYPRSTAGSRFV